MASLAFLKHRPWPLPVAVAPRLNKLGPIEEENTPYYSPSHFYPAYIGEILNGRYQVTAKIGYGSSSTVWLARDLMQWRWLRDKYVALKINTSTRHSRDVKTELDTLQLLCKSNPRHKGCPYVRHLLDSFELNYESRKHLILVFEPLREPLWIYRRRFIGDAIPSDVLKIMLQMILQGLDYLHAECHIIHTDLKPDNIMVKIEDLSILDHAAKDEYKNPLPQKACSDGRTIYLSRNNYGLPRKTTGVIQITDFDLSVPGDRIHSGCIQAEIYRAPEVILDCGYSYSADIWNLGVMLWDILEGRKLFRDIDPVRVHEYDELNHFAHIIALLGPPPREILEKGRRTSQFYNSGEFKGPKIGAEFNFETSLSQIKGDDKRMFISFVKRMIKWRPEERSTPRELLEDPWLSFEAE
ncbi:putative protein kinase [Aspergillus tanneri]|uniref:non-specific serine/threonine protein kinase n=1 Tax=Aspergillus tanneri TaxID=1220188 RepID=A0A5M9MCC3_9EURO|nr:uncharacterized protein ATNIH1004_010124 [Aspergillus tanneri]KAA8643356.1 hypothetical protein ATNIH1004_010124 [Aspergillus tanneri]